MTEKEQIRILEALVKKQDEIIAVLQAQVATYQVVFSHTENAIQTLKHRFNKQEV